MFRAGWIVAAVGFSCGGGSDGQSSPDAQDTIDAGAVMVTCDDEAAAVYEAVAQDQVPGSIVACAESDSASAEELSARIAATGVSATTGYSSRLIAYATRRDDDTVGTGTAVLFLPDVVLPNSPIVAVAHGTIGHADRCAPSTQEPNPNLVLPSVAMGMVTIAVDYAGLGNAGIQGYGDAYDTAQSLLDGARAAQAWVGGQPAVALLGHSQGGRAVHFAQGLAPSYSPELTVSAAVALAGGPVAPPSPGPIAANLYRQVPLNVSSRAFFAMTVYADFANRLGEDRAGEVFASTVRAKMLDSMENECIGEMIVNLATPTAGYVPPTNVESLVATEWLDSFVACAGGVGTCTVEGQAILDQRFGRSFVPVSSTGAPLLVFGAENDAIHTPSSHACAYDEVVSSGATVERCFMAGVDHSSMVPAGIEAALDFVVSGSLNCPPQAPAPTCE